MEADLLETARFTFGPSPNPPVLATRPLSCRLGAGVDSRYLEKVKEFDLDDLECRQELAEVLGLKHVSHEDLSRHQCVDWLKAHETHFSRARMTKTADLTGIPMRSVMGPINYRPLKLLGSPGLIVEPPKHRTSIARIR